MDDTPANPPEGAKAPGALAFTPVPYKQPHQNGWTERRQRDFITALATMGSVLHAARAVGMTKQAAYQLRNRPGAESFAMAWDVAISIGYDDAFDRALERATIGITTPRYYKGKRVGTKHRFDYRLAIAALNGMPPNPVASRKKTTR